MSVILQTVGVFAASFILCCDVWEAELTCSSVRGGRQRSARGVALPVTPAREILSWQLN